MTALKLSFKEMLRAAKPDGFSIGLFCFLTVIVLLMCLEFGSSFDERQAAYLQQIHENQVIQALHDPHTAETPLLAKDAATVRGFFAQLDTHYPDDTLRPLVLKGYLSLYKNDVSPHDLHHKIEPILDQAILKEHQSAQTQVAVMFQLFDKLAEDLDNALEMNFSWKARDLLQDIVAIFPVNASMRQAYTELWGIENASMKHMLIGRPHAITQAIKGDVNGMLHKIPEAPQGRSSVDNVKVVIGIALVALSSWTYGLYLSTVHKLGIRPWHIRWSMATCLLTLFWSIPIIVVGLSIGVGRVFETGIRIVGMVIFGDFTRPLRALRGEEEGFFQTSAYDAALTALLTRIGWIEYQLADLQTKKEMDQTDQFDEEMSRLECERAQLDDTVSRFQEKAGANVSIPVTETLSVIHNQEAFRTRYEAFRKIDPAHVPELKELSNADAEEGGEEDTSEDF